MTLCEKRKKIDDLIVQINLIKNETMAIGLRLTSHAMHEVQQKVGWELEALIKKGEVSSKQTYGDVAQGVERRVEDSGVGCSIQPVSTKLKKPKPPLCRIIREGGSKFCPECGSTYLTRYKVFYLGIRKIQGCIQPKCDLFEKSLI